MSETTTPMLQVCIVCLHEKPLDEFPENKRRRSGHDRRCSFCVADLPDPVPTEQPAPPRHYCGGCGCRVLKPGVCGFCHEERTGDRLTKPVSVPEAAQNTPRSNRLGAARVIASLSVHATSTVAVERALRACCPRGHPYDEDNTRINGSGSRSCRTCDTERKREARARARQPVPAMA